MMTEEPFVTKKTMRFQQRQVDKYHSSGFSDFSKFVRHAIDMYDVQYEDLRMTATVDAYNDCITKLSVERDFVLQVRQNGVDGSYKLQKSLQNAPDNASFVRQVGQNTTKNDDFVIQNTEDENPVGQNTSQNEEETENFVPQMEQNQYYEKMKPHLSLLSRQLNVKKNVSDDTKKMISEATALTKTKVTSFIYEFRNEIMEVPYEIPDENDRDTTKIYNRLTKTFS